MHRQSSRAASRSDDEESSPPPPRAVVVTTFQFRSLATYFMFKVLHRRLHADVRRDAPGFISVSLVSMLRQRRCMSVSLWRDKDSIYDMGKVDRHVQSVRLTPKLAYSTSCTVFSVEGNWRDVLFPRRADRTDGASGTQFVPRIPPPA